MFNIAWDAQEAKNDPVIKLHEDFPRNFSLASQFVTENENLNSLNIRFKNNKYPNELVTFSIKHAKRGTFCNCLSLSMRHDEIGRPGFKKMFYEHLQAFRELEKKFNENNI